MYLSPLTREAGQRDMDNNNKRIGYPMSGDKENENGKVLVPSIFHAPTKEHYHIATGFVQCLITRVGKNVYHFAFQIDGTEAVSMIGHKLKSSRTSNYHLFDALRGGMDAKLSKKSGHYIGKLRRDKDKRVGCYTLYNASREKQELAAFVYDIPAIIQQVKEGQPPRRMQAVIPKSTVSTNVGSGEAMGIETSQVTIKQSNPLFDHANTNRLIEHLHNGTWKHQKLLAVQTKPPKFHEGMHCAISLSAACVYISFHFLHHADAPSLDLIPRKPGQYRLNFSGRVLTPSVKNMQLESEQGEILLQFGKVDDQRFHLDYKAPFTAFSAFGAALCQFDL
eukprot:CCRYP_012412-RA/>CCRYP_012412-RA protein AED:0.04 eAED:-0.02 QI:0/0/0/1/1/1/2/0/335